MVYLRYKHIDGRYRVLSCGSASDLDNAAHVVPGTVLSKDVAAGKVKSVQGSSITVTTGAGGVMVDNAHVTAVDVLATNGVIHVIDAVIIPQ
jgi:uncharacterized surface protein with fasciclin (FAS1) repeats